MSNDVTEMEDKIRGRVSPDATGTMAVSRGGGVQFQNITQVMEAAKLMSIARVGVPKHLRSDPGACFAVLMQAINWGMEPFAVANKSYSVNDRIGWEAQLIAAVVLERCPIAEEPDYAFDGEGLDLRCTVSIKMRSGKVLAYRSPRLGDISPRNSPLWKSDPEQQIGYYSIRAWARRHQPNVLLGVYDREELEAMGPEFARDVTPRPASEATLAGKLGALAAAPKREAAVQTAPGEDQPQAVADATMTVDGELVTLDGEILTRGDADLDDAGTSEPETTELQPALFEDKPAAAPAQPEPAPKAKPQAEPAPAPAPGRVKLSDDALRAKGTAGFNKGIRRDRAIPPEYRDGEHEREVALIIEGWERARAAAAEDAS